MIRYMVWGDRRHFDIAFGRFSLVRWCAHNPAEGRSFCRGRHPVRLRIYNRTGSARSR